MQCRVGGCSNPVQDELRDHTLCLEHFLSDVHERIASFAHQLQEQDPQDSLRQTATQFVVLRQLRSPPLARSIPPKTSWLAANC